jgi:hypothetical protein
MIPTDHLQSPEDIKAAIAQAEEYRLGLFMNLNKVKKKQRRPIDYEDLELAICMERSIVEDIQEDLKTATNPTRILVMKEVLLERTRKLERMTLQEKRRGRESMLYYEMRQGVYESQLQLMDDYINELKGRIENIA